MSFAYKHLLLHIILYSCMHCQVIFSIFFKNFLFHTWGYDPKTSFVAVKALEKNVRWKTNYESIYQWIYSEHHELIPFLVRSHKKRRKRGSGKQKRCSKIPNRIMIDKRPEYINLRTGIGHWEIDIGSFSPTLNSIEYVSSSNVIHDVSSLFIFGNNFLIS